MTLARLSCALQPCLILTLVQHCHSAAAKLLRPTCPRSPLAKESVPRRRWLLEWDVSRGSWPASHLSARNPSTSLRCSGGAEDSRFLSRVQRITSIIMILCLFLRSFWHISWGAARLGKNKKWGRAVGRKRASHYHPSFFLGGGADYSASTSRDVAPVHSALFLCNCCITLSSLYRHYRNASHQVNTLFVHFHAFPSCSRKSFFLWENQPTAWKESVQVYAQRQSGLAVPVWGTHNADVALAELNLTPWLKQPSQINTPRGSIQK